MTTLRHARTGGRRAWVRPVVIGAALILGAGIGTGGTFALWNDPGSAGPAALTTGDLSVTVVGTPVWTQTERWQDGAVVKTTPQPVDPATFLVRPGDTLVFEQAFTTLLRGHNLEGSVTVGLNGSLPANATYVIYQGTTALSAPTALGAVAGAPGGATPLLLPGNDAGITSNLSVKVTIPFALDGPNASVPGTTAPNPYPLALNGGQLTIALDQVRTEAGSQP